MAGYTMKPSEAKALRCVTHHHACDCREYAFREAIGDLLDELADTGVDTTHHPARELLIRPKVTVDDVAGIFDGPDSVEWLREQRR